MSFARMSNVLEHDQTAASPRAGPLGMAGQSHCRGGAASTARRSRGYLRAARPAGARPRAPGRSDGKTGHFRGGVHRPAGKSRNFAAGGVHRLAPSRAPQAQCVRAASRAHRRRRCRLGRNAMAIWQDLVDEVGFTARYASVRRFVRQLRGARRRPRRASSSPPRRARKRRSTTATGRWSAIRRPASIAGRASLS